MTRLYRVWIQMRQRCANPNDQAYRYYGEIGINVCDEWQNYEAFKRWAESNGYKQGLTIERMNPRRHYEPDNCEWITREENSHRMHYPKIAA